MHHLIQNLTALALFAALTIFPVTQLLAGNLDAPAAPGDAGSAMYTLEDIYDRLNSNTQATKRAGAFTEPSAGPASTGHTLDEVYAKAIPTQVPKTGQTTSYVAGDDGDLEKGVAWPGTRFTDNSDGTVTDNLTGLMWLKNANNAESTMLWAAALTYCNDLVDSGYSDWRLPNIKELLSLVDYGQLNPALPSGHPFTGASGTYWSSTTKPGQPTHALAVSLYAGVMVFESKAEVAYGVWPVRGGQ